MYILSIRTITAICRRAGVRGPARNGGALYTVIKVCHELGRKMVVRDEEWTVDSGGKYQETMLSLDAFRSVTNVTCDKV